MARIVIMPINDVYVSYLCLNTKHDFISVAQIYTFIEGERRWHQLNVCMNGARLFAYDDP